LNDLPPELSKFIRRLLEREPAKRPNDAAAALAELKATKESLERAEASRRNDAAAALAELKATKESLERAEASRRNDAAAALAELKATKKDMERAETSRRTERRWARWLSAGLAISLALVIAGWALDRVGRARRADEAKALIGVQLDI